MGRDKANFTGNKDRYRQMTFEIECCGEIWKNPKEFETHRRGVSHEIPKTKCFVCEEVDESMIIDYDHRWECLRNLKAKCVEVGNKNRYRQMKFEIECCGEIWKNPKELENHRRGISHEIPKTRCFVCDEFDESFVIDYDHRYECIKSLTSIEIVCCDVKWKSLITLAEHRRDKHQIPKGVCCICGEIESPDFLHLQMCLKNEKSIGGNFGLYADIKANRKCCEIQIEKLSEFELHLIEAHALPKNSCIVCGKLSACYDHRRKCWLAFCGRKKNGNVKRYRKLNVNIKCCGFGLGNVSDVETHMIWSHKAPTHLCFMCEEFDESLTIDCNHRFKCFMEYQRRLNPEARQLIYDAEHDVYIDQTQIKTTANISKDLYLNCEECDDWSKVGWSEINRNTMHMFIDDYPCTIWEDMYPTIDNPLQELPNRIEFDEHCGIDARWLILFGTGNYKFYHVMIRQQVWISFCTVVYKKGYYFLPYWCLCNGGDESTTNKVHRHMIVATKEPIENIVHSLKDWYVGKTFERGSQSKEIKTYGHLMNVIRYVSNRESHCRGVDLEAAEIAQPQEAPTKRRKLGISHFYIAKPIIPCSLYMMSLLHEDGLATMSNILYGGVGIIDAIADVPNLKDLKNVTFNLFTNIRGHVIPLNMTHSTTHTKYHIELGNHIDKRIIRCYIPSDQIFNNQFANVQGSLLMEVALQSSHKLTTKQRAIAIRVGKVKEEMAAMKQSYEIKLQEKECIINELKNKD